MQIPELLQEEIEALFQRKSRSFLAKTRKHLSEHYAKGGTSSFEDEEILLAYLGARMPSTFAAVSRVMKEVSLKGDLLDLGAGPGSASWAVCETQPEIDQITLIEKSPLAIEVGKNLSASHPILKKAKWVQGFLEGNKELPQAENGILSYVISEMKDPLSLIEKCFKAVSTLIIIEPGTPKAFQGILKVRDKLLSLGAYLLAPCPHFFACPMKDSDWCHFKVRVERTKLQRQLKQADLNYEDEKFCYLIASKEKKELPSSRIVRHPIKKTGRIHFSLCTQEGTLQERIISKKEKEIYSKARKLEWGDFL